MFQLIALNKLTNTATSKQALSNIGNSFKKSQYLFQTKPLLWEGCK